MFLTNFLLELLDLFYLYWSCFSRCMSWSSSEIFLEYKYLWYHLWLLEKKYACWTSKTSCWKHFSSVGFESIAEGFESLSVILSFQMMDSNPYVGDSNPWSFTNFCLKNTLIDSNHFDLDSNHLVQIWVSRWWIRIHM